MDLTKSAYVGFRLHEVVPCLTETGHIWASGVDRGRRAPSGKACRRRTVRRSLPRPTEGVRLFRRADRRGRGGFDGAGPGRGRQVVQPENRAEWEAGARKVWASLAPQLGGLDKIEAVASS